MSLAPLCHLFRRNRELGTNWSLIQRVSLCLQVQAGPAVKSIKTLRNHPRIQIVLCFGSDGWGLIFGKDVCLTNLGSGDNLPQTWLTCKPFSERPNSWRLRRPAGAMKDSGAAPTRQQNAVTMTMVHRIIALEDIVDTIPVNICQSVKLVENNLFHRRETQYIMF